MHIAIAGLLKNGWPAGRRMLFKQLFVALRSANNRCGVRRSDRCHTRLLPCRSQLRPVGQGFGPKGQPFVQPGPQALEAIRKKAS